MIHAIILLAFLGFFLWAVTALLPMPAPFKTAIIGIGCLFALLIVLQALGIDTGFHLA